MSSLQKSLWNYTDSGDVASKLGSNINYPREEAFHGSIPVSLTSSTPQKNITSVFEAEFFTKLSMIIPPLRDG